MLTDYLTRRLRREFDATMAIADRIGTLTVRSNDRKRSNHELRDFVRSAGTVDSGQRSSRRRRPPLVSLPAHIHRSITHE